MMEKQKTRAMYELIGRHEKKCSEERKKKNELKNAEGAMWHGLGHAWLYGSMALCVILI